MTTPEAQPQPKGSEDQVADGGDTFLSSPSQLVAEDDLRPQRQSQLLREVVPIQDCIYSDTSLNILVGRPSSAFSVLLCREANSKHLAMK